MRRDYCWAVRAIFMASVMQLLASYVTAVPMSNYNEHQAGVGGEQEIVTARHQYATVARAIDAYAYGDGARADAVQLERVRHLLHDGHLALTSVDYGRLALRAMLGARWPDAFNAVVEVSVEATTTPFNEVVRSIAIDPVRYHAVGERFYSRLRRKLHLGVTGHVARPDLTDFLHQHALLLDFVDPRNGRTALVEAMLRGDVVMARALLAAGADPVKGIVCRGTRASRTSPLHLAAMRPLLTGLIPDLVEAGTPVDAVDVDGRTAMYWAVATVGHIRACVCLSAVARLIDTHHFPFTSSILPPWRYFFATAHRQDARRLSMKWTIGIAMRRRPRRQHPDQRRFYVVRLFLCAAYDVALARCAWANPTQKSQVVTDSIVRDCCL